jgi:hypothetical protein
VGRNTEEAIYDVSASLRRHALRHPWFQTLPRMLASRLYASLPDRYGAEQIALIYPEVTLRGWAMAPPAIRKSNDHSRAGSGRSIDLLYVGNLAPQALERPWRDIPAAAAAFDAAADWALAHPDRPLHHALAGPQESRRTPGWRARCCPPWIINRPSAPGGQGARTNRRPHA